MTCCLKPTKSADPTKTSNSTVPVRCQLYPTPPKYYDSLTTKTNLNASGDIFITSYIATRLLGNSSGRLGLRAFTCIASRTKEIWKSRSNHTGDDVVAILPPPTILTRLPRLTQPTWLLWPTQPTGLLQPTAPTWLQTPEHIDWPASNNTNGYSTSTNTTNKIASTNSTNTHDQANRTDSAASTVTTNKHVLVEVAKLVKLILRTNTPTQRT